MIIDVDCIDFKPSHKGQIPAEQIRDLGIKFDKWESHTIASIIRLVGCTNISTDLPSWYKVRSDLK